MTRKRTAIFTISSNNYMAYSATLINSSVAAHPDADHFIGLADDISHLRDFYPENCTIVRSDALGIPDFEGFAFRYDIMEFNTAIKPFMILHLMSMGYDRVIYFDPDIKVYAPITPVFASLDAGASVVLTPHLTGPSEMESEPNDITIMRAGIYNLGFVAFARKEGVEAVLRWWARRLRYECINAQPEGIFVDQKFMDLVPGFLEDVAILRHTGLNGAYWNLDQRALTQDEDGWHIDANPLIFFHFSGYDPRNSPQLSKHTQRFAKDNSSELLALLADYRKDLLSNGHREIPRGGYAYERFASGTRINTEMRRQFRDTYLAWSGDPFRVFEHHLSQIAPGTAMGTQGRACTMLMQYIWQNSSYLRSTFDLGAPSGVDGVVDWFIAHSQHSGIDQRLAAPVLERMANGRKAARIPSRVVLDRHEGTGVDADCRISLVGYLTADTGVGEVGRQTVRVLSKGSRAIEGIDVSLNVHATRNNRSCDPFLVKEATGDLQLFNINADQLPQVQNHLAGRLRDDAYRVAVPFWELAEFPDEWVPAFERIDEIWAPTRFIQQAIIAKVDKPVLYMPIALDFTYDSELDRSHFGLPEDKFIFLFSFDFLSFHNRKNPWAVIDAFERAFLGQPDQDEVVLVIKCSNAASAAADMVRLRGGANPRLAIRFIEDSLSRREILNLVRVSDCVVSLHRSEGLGLLVAEAMALRVPVISTDYSATTELVSHNTGFPVDYRLIPLSEGDYPFPTGKFWADPDPAHAAWQMRCVVQRPPQLAQILDAAAALVESQHGAAAVLRRYDARIEELGL